MDCQDNKDLEVNQVDSKKKRASLSSLEVLSSVVRNSEEEVQTDDERKSRTFRSIPKAGLRFVKKQVVKLSNVNNRVVFACFFVFYQGFTLYSIADSEYCKNFEVNIIFARFLNVLIMVLSLISYVTSLIMVHNSKIEFFDHGNKQKHEIIGLSFLVTIASITITLPWRLLWGIDKDCGFHQVGYWFIYIFSFVSACWISINSIFFVIVLTDIKAQMVELTCEQRDSLVIIRETEGLLELEIEAGTEKTKKFKHDLVKEKYPMLLAVKNIIKKTLIVNTVEMLVSVIILLLAIKLNMLENILIILSSTSMVPFVLNLISALLFNRHISDIEETNHLALKLSVDLCGLKIGNGALVTLILPALSFVIKNAVSQ